MDSCRVLPHWLLHWEHLPSSFAFTLISRNAPLQWIHGKPLNCSHIMLFDHRWRCKFSHKLVGITMRWLIKHFILISAFVQPARPGSNSNACNIRLLYVTTSPVLEQHCVVYKISIPKCLYFITYFNRHLETWLAYVCIPYVFRCSRHKSTEGVTGSQWWNRR